MGNTKDKLEQAAKECADSFLLTDFYMGSDIKDAIMEAFEAGANWQKEQSPWISVEEKAGCDTSDDCIVMVKSGEVFRAYFSSKGEWLKYDYYDEVIDGVVRWMPIPE